MSLKKLLFLGLLAACFAFPADSASAADPAASPDYAPINKALNDFFAVLDNLKTELPKIHDASGAAKAVDSFTSVTNAFAASLEEFVQKNPELARAPQPPPEMADVLKKFAASKDAYPTLGEDLGRAVRPFADDPVVRPAIEKFQQAMVRVNKLGGAQ